MKTDHLIGVGGQHFGGVGSTDGNRQHHPARTVGAGHLASRLCGRPGRDAVIHDHRDPPRQRDLLTSLAKPLRPTLQLGPLLLFDRGHVLVAEVRLTHDRLVDHPHPALADGAEGQFGLKWHTKLAHHKNIQRCSQRLGDFEGHRHPAARQPQHDNVLAAQKSQAPCQLTSGVSTILEQPHVLSVSRAVVHR